MASAEEQVARKTLAIRLKRELGEIAKELQKWQGRVELARGQGRADMATAAQERVGELTEKARALWKQMDELLTEERFAELEIDDELKALKQQVRRDASEPVEFEPVDDELEALKRQIQADRPSQPPAT